MKISQLRFYGRSRDKICRLGLAQAFVNLEETLLATGIHVLRRKHANSADRVGERIYAELSRHARWKRSTSGSGGWIKVIRHGRTAVSRIGVEVQVSGRSDLLARDIVHIRNNLQDSHIDVGVIVVPADAFEYYLTDRVANFSYAVRYVEQELREAQAYPIILIGVEHDGYSEEPLPKKRTNQGKA